MRRVGRSRASALLSQTFAQFTHALKRHLRVLRRCVSALVLALAAPSAADYGILAPQCGQSSLAPQPTPTHPMLQRFNLPERSAFGGAGTGARQLSVCLPNVAWALLCRLPARPHQCHPLEHAGPGQHDVRPHRGAGPARARARRQGVPVRRLRRCVEGGRGGAQHPALPAPPPTLVPAGLARPAPASHVCLYRLVRHSAAHPTPWSAGGRRL